MNTRMLGDLGLGGYESLPPEALFPMIGQLLSNLADKLMDLTNVADRHHCLEVISRSLLS
jgi:hypothetical protein